MKNIVEIKKSFFLERNGFTLVEILVALSLFSFTILMATGVFGAVMRGQRNTLASQNIQESMRYALEVMGKEIRMAQASDGVCNTLFNPQPTPLNKVYNITTDNSGNQILYFKNQNGDCAAYYLVNGKINIMRNYNNGAITSTSFQISNLKFSLIDNGIGSLSDVQPMVAMRMDAVSSGDNNQKINIQTSISSREYSDAIDNLGI